MASTDERLGRLGLQHLVRKPEELKAALLRKKRGLQVEDQEKEEKILRGRNDLRHYVEESDHKGDELFLKAAGIHPLVAAFIALPSKPTQRIMIESSITNHRNLLLESGTSDHGGKQVLTNLPSGMLGRRILMYFFAKYYQDKSYIYHLDEDHIFWSDLGYNGSDRHIKKLAIIGLTEFLRSKLRFADFADNKFFLHYRGEVDAKEMNTRLVLVDQEGKGDNGAIIYNQSGLFKMAFPVDFEQVKRMKKKKEFWNIYLFLVDVLPRIPQGEKPQIEWSVVKALFSDNYSTKENFIYHFKRVLKQVLEIYPTAKRNVIVSRSDVLILKHTPPPI